MSDEHWFRGWFRGEDANSFAMLLTMLPMLISAFGLGVDMSHNQYIRNELQAAADMATVAGTAMNNVDSTRTSRIDPDAAVAVMRQTYNANRDSGPATLDCLSGKPKECWVEYRKPTISTNRQVLAFYVQEQSRNGFLSIVGISKQQYHVVSKARVNQTTE